MWNYVNTLHPSYLALSPYAKVRRQYRTLLAPSEAPRPMPAIPLDHPAGDRQRSLLGALRLTAWPPRN